MSISSTLFPPANREAAAVAFLRTFWQVLRATLYLGGGSAIVVTATQLAHINLQELGLAVGAILASAILSGALSAGNILANGLPDAYVNASVSSIPGAVTSISPTLTPADPSQPAAGVPPAPVPVNGGLGLASLLPTDASTPPAVVSAVDPQPVATDPAAPVAPAVPAL